MTEEQKHTAGDCWCGMIHTVRGAEELNGDTPPVTEYEAMIRRTSGQEDPLVQEPKK